MLKVLPFGNTVGVLDLSGAQVLELLRHALRMSPGSGAYAQWDGVRMVVAGGEPTQVRIGGQPLDAQRRYRVAMTNFTASGGDGYPRYAAQPGWIDTGFNDADVLRGYIARHSPLKAADYDPGDAIVWQ